MSKAKKKYRLTPGTPSLHGLSPIIDLEQARGPAPYLWIGNDSETDMRCFGTIGGRKTLLRLAHDLIAALEGKGD
jgi:hypothetical protein